VYISTVQLGITIVCCSVVSSLWVYEVAREETTLHHTIVIPNCTVLIYTHPLHYQLTTNRPACAHLFLLARPLPRSKPNQIYIPPTILPLTYFIHLPMKLEPIVSSETSATKSQTPGNYPKRNKLQLFYILRLVSRNLYVSRLHLCGGKPQTRTHGRRSRLRISC